MRRAFEQTGYYLYKPPNFNYALRDAYIDLMERYFTKRSQQFYQTGTCDDIYPQYKSQSGLSVEYGAPNFDPKSLQSQKDQPEIVQQDKKWKFFWLMNQSQQFTPPMVIPKDFPEFYRILNAWGAELLSVGNMVGKQLAIEYGEKEDFLTSRIGEGDHIMAPIGCDLQRNAVNTRFSGYHYDLNFCTVHAHIKFPGLFAWLPSGERVEIAIPDGHFFIQAGMQMEFMTGGRIKAGYHEALYTQQAKDIADASKNYWRVTSTMFVALGSNVILEPMASCANPQYAPISVKDRFKFELEQLKYK